MTSGPRRAVLAAGVLIGLGAAALVMGRAPPDGPPSLRKAVTRSLRPGVELVEAHVRARGRDRGRLVALFVDLASTRAELALNPALDSLRAVERGPAWAIANAGYFTERHRPTGLIVSGGQVLHPFIPEAGGAGSGVLAVIDAKVELIERDAVEREQLERAEIALQAGPRIIEPDGGPGIRSDDGMRANRTVLGRDRRGRLVLAVIYGPEAGLGVGPTLFELQQILGPEGLGVVRPELALEAALNLDGGPSTGLFLPGHIDLPPVNRVVSVIRFVDR